MQQPKPATIYNKFQNTRPRCIKFTMPRTQNQILQSYRSPKQFQLWIQRTNSDLLGFRLILRYELNGEPWKYVEEDEGDEGEEFGGEEARKLEHRWECQVCRGFILYRWSMQRQEYCLYNYEITHIHHAQYFKPYLYEQHNQTNQHPQTELYLNIQPQIPPPPSTNEQPQNKPPKKRGPYMKNDQQYDKAHSGSDSEEEMGDEDRFRDEELVWEASEEERGIEMGVMDQQQQVGMYYTSSITYIPQTQKLLSYLTPHKFHSPPLTSIPNQLPSTLSHSQLSSQLTSLHNSLPQLKNQVWSIQVQGTILADQHDHAVKFHQRQVVIVYCECLGSLVTRCPFCLVWEKGVGQDGFLFCGGESFVEHHHVQSLVDYNNSKLAWLHKSIPISDMPHLQCQSNQPIDQLFQFTQKILTQKTQPPKSLLLLLPKPTLLLLFPPSPSSSPSSPPSPHPYTIHTPCTTITNYPQISKNILPLLQQSKHQPSDDVLLISNCLMEELYTVFGRVLVVQNCHVLQRFFWGCRYQVYLFKGCGYTGVQVVFGIGVMRDDGGDNDNRIQLMLDLFMKNKSPPAILLISNSDPLLNTTCTTYFLQHHPQTTKLTRQTHKSHKFHANLVQMQALNMQSNLVMSDEEMGRLYDYGQLVARNSCLVVKHGRNGGDGCNGGNGHGGDIIGDQGVLGHFVGDGGGYGGGVKLGQLVSNQEQLRYFMHYLIQKTQKTNQKHRQKLIFQFPAERTLQIPQLQTIRVLCSKKPFKILLQNLTKTSQLSIQVSNPPHFYIVNSRHYSNIVTLNPNKKNPLLLCDCGVRGKTGIPCQHILKVAVMENYNFVECVDKFWLMDSYAILKHSVETGQTKIKTPLYVLPQSRKRIFYKLFHRKYYEPTQNSIQTFCD